MSERRLIRRKKKLQKMAALIKLGADGETEDGACSTPVSTNSRHEQMIQELESQMNGGSVPAGDVRKRKLLEPETHFKRAEDDDGDVVSAYRKLMAKKRKELKSTQLVQIYIDQPFLSRCRQKRLLYNENAPQLTNPIALHTSDVQQFIMYNLFGRNSLYRPRWCSIQFVSSVSQVLTIAVEGVSWLDVNVSMPAAWAHTRHLLSNQSVRMTSPLLYGGSLEEDLFMVPLPPSEVSNSRQKQSKDTKEEDCSRLDDVSIELDVDLITQGSDTFPRTLLLLSFSDLVAEGFPVPDHSSFHSNDDQYEGFDFSQASYAKATDSSPLYAVDCEMVTTNNHKLSVASICVVNEKLEVVYKTYVKPDNPITDYLTRYSGITAQVLDKVTTSLRQVQADLRQLLPPDAILCGQSLNNDLVALKLFHPYVIDSSVCYNLKGMSHSKTGLRRLAAQFLRREIQSGSSGHCPKEDAIATMELVLLKLRIGYSFGNVMADGLMSTPSSFFKQLPGKTSNISHPETLICKDNTKTRTNVDQCSTPGSITGQPTGTGEIDAKSSTSRQVSPDSDLSQSIPETSLSESETTSKDAINTKPAISQLAAFSRKTIAQLEVNMFDLMGHHDSKKAVICTKCLKMREPHDSSSVTLHTCDKTKQVIKRSKKALKSGTSLVYANIARARNGADVKKFVSTTDEHISELWDGLLPGGLCCLVLSGTENQHGAVMFAVKPHQIADACKESAESQTDADVYSMMYNCSSD